MVFGFVTLCEEEDRNSTKKMNKQNSQVKPAEGLKMKDEFSLEAKFYDKIWGKHDYDADVKFLDDLFKEHGCRSVIDI